MDEQSMRRQDSVFTRGQLSAMGVDRWKLRNELAARRWQIVGRAVVLHNGPLTRRQRMWCAVLSQPQPAALCSVSTIELVGLRGFDDEVIHVLAVDNSMRYRMPGVRRHLSRAFDVRPVWGLPSVSTAVAVVQAASWDDRARRGCALLIAAVQQQRVTVADISAVLTTFHGRRAALLR